MQHASEKSGPFAPCVRHD